MPAAARIGDIVNTGHACTTVVDIALTLQSNVKIDGKLAAVVGSQLADHTFLSGSSCIPHSATVTAGSSKVFIGGIAVSRIGDTADMGAIITGSSSVFIGG
jgi:uncharacterized Zn-binding protein involved in type VI secretion